MNGSLPFVATAAAIAVVAAMLYYVLPAVLWQWANLGVLRRGSGAWPEAALTFDDGPDPETTPKVLDALDAAGAKATFFLLGEKALAHPEIVRDIARRGHEVGCHGFRHRHAFLRTPWGVAADMERGAAAIAQVNGQRPRLFRPAHGAYVLASLFALRRSRLAPVHWSLESRDWHSAFTPESVRERIIQQMEPGVIVCLHDAGPGAKITVSLVPDLLGDLTRRGYRLVSVSDLRGLRAGSLRETAVRLWQLVERGFDRAAKIDAITAEHAECVFRFSPARYYGPPLTLSDGSCLHPGDEAAEIHLHSERVQSIVRQRPRALLRCLRRSMEVSAHVVRNHPRYSSMRVFFGVSLRPELYIPLGCNAADLPSRRPFLTRYLRLLRTIYGSGRARKQLEPKIVWIDRRTLLERYAPEGRETGGARNA